MNFMGSSHAVQSFSGKHSPHAGSGNGKKVLKSWKEIARHMGCSVRTVQRWEIDFQLPVHRPKGRGRGAVIAAYSELDSWVISRPLEMRKPDLHAQCPVGSQIIEHIQDSQHLRAQVRESRRQLLDSVTRLKQTLAKMMLD